MPFEAANMAVVILQTLLRNCCRQVNVGTLQNMIYDGAPPRWRWCRVCVKSLQEEFQAPAAEQVSQSSH